MLVLFSCGDCKILFAGRHAPHRAHERHLVQEWWSVTCQLCCEYGRDASLVVAGHFNARVGSQLSRHVGALDPDLQDQAGDCVHVLLE